MSVSWPFSVYLCDRQAKQSERSLHSDTVPWCWNESKGKMARVCVGVCVRVEWNILRRRGATSRMCVSAFVCVCLSPCDRSSASECALECACCRPWQSVCFSVCVQGYTFTRTLEGCLTFGSQFKQWDTPLSIHSFRSLSRASLKAKWKISQQ